MNKKLTKIFARPDEKIRAVVKRLTENKNEDASLPPGITLVVDKKEKLLGIVTNGDLRRAFAAGVELDEQISKVMNKNPSVIVAENSSAILPTLFGKIKAGEWPKNRLEKILVVDKNNNILDLVSFYDLVHTSDVKFKHIGVVGLGYVGLTLALTLADLGYKVIGQDNNPKVLELLKKGKAHFYEDGLQELIADNLGKNFTLVESFSGKNNCDIYFVAVGTPLDSQMRPHLDLVSSAAKSIGKVLKHGDAVVLRSTVPLGTTRNVVTPILEKESGLKAGEDFLVAFAPERTIEGKALEELRHLPQVIGGLNQASTDLVSNIFNTVTKSTVLVDSLESAEMVKLINNVYRDVTFGFSNEIAIVSKLWGIDTKKVIEAANFGYHRSNIPFPSPGVGGYCLEKDPFIFIESARAMGYDAQMPKHARAVSDAIMGNVSKEVSSFLKKNKKGKNAKILALGIAFKGNPATSDLRGSTAVKILNKIKKENYKNIHAYDPAVFEHDISSHGFKYAKTPEIGFKGADAILILNNNPLFSDLKIRKLLKLSKNPTLVFDGWSMLNADEISKENNVHYQNL